MTRGNLAMIAAGVILVVAWVEGVPRHREEGIKYMLLHDKGTI